MNSPPAAIFAPTHGVRSAVAFKIYVGLMGHPYDMCELLLNHAEFAALQGQPIGPNLRRAVAALGAMLPGTRASRIWRTLDSFPSFCVEGPSAERVSSSLASYGCEAAETNILTRFVKLESFDHMHVVETERPVEVLANMRASEYPEPPQFQRLVAVRSAWSFVDGGRLIGALMRCIYMVDRTAYVAASTPRDSKPRIAPARTSPDPAMAKPVPPPP